MGVKRTTVTVRDNVIKQCRSCPLECFSNKRIQLRTYKYNNQDVSDPTMLFTLCSWRKQCNINITLIQGIMNSTANGELVIIYVCKASDTERSMCNTSIKTVHQTNLMYQGEVTSSLSDNQQSPSVLAGISSCSCHITGLFKIKIRDLRLPYDVITRPLVTVKVCNETYLCSTERFNSSNRVQFNGGVTRNVISSEIYLENMSISSVMVWIQITTEGAGNYSINCSTSQSTKSTAAVVTSEITTGLDTSSSTSLSAQQSTQQQQEVTTLSNHLSIPPVTSTDRTSSGVTAQETPVPGANRGDLGDQEASAVPTAGIVVPIVLVIIGSACALGAVMICRRRRKRNTNMANSIVNQSYEDTSDDLHIPSVSDKMRSGSESFDSGIPETHTDYSNVEPQADDQYNIIENNIDEEYNKINFQQTPIPFDQNYGHIISSNPVQNKEYDHVDGVQEIDLQTYSHVNQQVLKDEAESKGQSAKTQSNQSTQPIADSTYDHLAMSIGTESQESDELQGDDYSHLPSSGANTAHTNPRRGNRDRNVVKPYDLSNTAKQTAESKDMEHAYFVLESDNNAAMPQTEGNTTDTAVQPYFILEPSAKLPYTQIEKKIGEKAEHPYFTLEPDPHSMKH